MEIVLLVVGLGVGALVGWLVAAQRAQQQVSAAESRAVQAEATLEAEQSAGARLRETLEAERAAAAERFAALAADALAKNNERFLTLADERLAKSTQAHSSELAKREEAVRHLVEPISKTLEAVKEQVSHAEKERALSQGELKALVQGIGETSQLLRTETSQLVTALRTSHVRGAWGEMQLRRVVEAAGMLDRVDFDEQQTAQTDDGALRPDMVVRLAGGKNVVVDAKVPFIGYLEAQQADEAAVREERLRTHARHMRQHVDQLAAKQYWAQFSPTPEFVVMFVPAEPFLAAALDEDAGLFEFAIRKNVLIATPTTLLTVLRTIAYTWRQEAIAENAQQVLSIGRELHSRLSTLGGYLAKLGRSLTTSANDYNRLVSSLETRVLPQARRFVDLKVVDSDLDTIDPVDPGLKVLGAPELVASASEQVVAIEDIERAADAPDRDRAPAHDRDERPAGEG